MDIARQAKTIHSAGQSVELYPIFAEGGYKAACDRAGEREEHWNPIQPAIRINPMPPPTRINGLTIAQWAWIAAGALSLLSPLLLFPELSR